MPNSNPSPQEIFDKREEYGLENSIDMLIDIIETDKDSSRRKSAIKLLGNIIKFVPNLNKECFAILENLLISELNIGIKCEAAIALGKLKNEKALKPLKWTLAQKSVSVELRLAVLKAIMKTKFKDHQITIFINELDSEYSSIREFVRSHLVGLEPETLIRLLLDNLERENLSNKHKSEIIKLIGYELSSINISFQDRDYIKVKYPELVSSLLLNKALLLKQITRNLKTGDNELINSATLILRLLTPEINKDVIKLLLNDDFIIRKNAITIVGKLKLKDAVESLYSGLDNIYREVSVATIEALGEIGDLSSVPELLDVLNVEDISFEYTDIDMKFYIMDAVKKIYSSNKGASYDFLLSNLKSNSETLKESIAFLLGEIGNEEFTDPLTELLKTRNLDVKKNAIIALGKIGSIDPITHLIEILENPDSYWLIKKVAIDAIYNIFQRNWYRIKENNVEFKRTLTKHIATLIDVLKKSEAENAKVKISIIKFLETYGDELALSALLARVNDFPKIVRIHASNAIKKIEDKIEERLGLDTVD